MPSTDLKTFELIMEHRGGPVAAIIPNRVTDKQICSIFDLLPVAALNQPELARRWGADMVLASDDWRQAQLRRWPMLKPKGVGLAFVSLEPTQAAKALRDTDTAFKILKLVSDHFDIPLSSIEGHARPWRFVWPRWCAIALISRYTTLRPSQLGRIVNRDHGTICHAVKQLKFHIGVGVYKDDAATFYALDEQVRSVLHAGK